jgi:hypothetical protein
VTGNPVLTKAIELEAERSGGRFYDDPLAFAAVAILVVERHSDEPARVTIADVEARLLAGMAGIGGVTAAA